MDVKQKQKALALALLFILFVAGTLVQWPGTLEASPPPSGTQVSSGTWKAAASMSEARTGAASVLLPDGRVLVTGGMGESSLLASTELYNGDGTFSPAAAMHFARSQHSAVVLQDGRVLVAGGTTLGEGPTNSGELYDPATDTWTPVNAMAEARTGHSATLLPNGQVLIAGGTNGSGTRATLELFDPEAQSFHYAGALYSPRVEHAAVALADGRVLIVGGSDGSAELSAVEIYDTTSGTVSPAAALSRPRVGHSATLLLDGSVLVAGGSYHGKGRTTAEVYDPVANTWTATGSLVTARNDHVALLLPHNNNVLILGGTAAGIPVATAELYAPWDGVFTPTGSPATPRGGASGVALAQDGLLLLAGGSGLASAELYGFATIQVHEGQPVTISGSGWVPGETVDLALQEGPAAKAAPVSAVADGSGSIQVDYSRRTSGSLSVTATGAVSEVQVQSTSTPDRPTTTTITSDSSPSVLGQSVTFTASVDAEDGAGLPTGTVEFLLVTGESTESLGTVELGKCEPGRSMRGRACASLSTSSLGLGEHTVEAKYSGDSRFLASSDLLVQAVTEPPPIATATIVGSKPNPSLGGEWVNFSASVLTTSEDPRPTGTVTFFDDATELATVALQPGSWATFNTPNLTVGAHSITVHYNGDANFAPSTSGVYVHTVNGGNTATTVVSTPNPSLGGEWVNFSASVLVTSLSASGGTVSASAELRPTGTVTFFDGTTELAIVALQPGSWATFNTPDLAAGSHSVTVRYNGDASFAPSTSTALIHTVNGGSTATTVVSSPNPSLGGEWVNFSASVLITSQSSSAGTVRAAEELRPTGTVTFFDGTTALATAALQPGSWATFNTPDLAAGMHSITVHYNGDANFAPSTSAVLTHSVNGGTTATTVVSSPNPSLGGEWVNFSASVLITSQSASGTSLKAADELRPTGTVTFLDGTTELATVPLQPGAWATFNTPDLAKGSHSITVKYNGDVNFASSTSEPLNHVVGLGTTSTTVVSTPNPSPAGEFVNFSASVLITSQSSSAGTVKAAAELRPTGTVTFFDGATELATVALQPGSWATFNTPNLSVGAHSITVKYNGDTNFAASTSAVLTHTVQ